MLEDPEQLVDGVRTERVEHVGPVEGDPDRAVRLRPVVGQVGQVLEARDVVPGLRVEGLRHSVERSHGATVPHAQPTDSGRAGRGAARVAPGRAARGSARKYSRASWDEASPAGTTGDWFDTTYDLVVLR